MPGNLTRLAGAAVLALTALAGCASTSASPAFRDVADAVEARSGHRPRWSQGTADDRQAEAAIERLLSRELSVDAAVQAALLGNPSLRSTFEELSIAQADLVQAGLLKNPVFGVGATAWEQEHIDPNLFFTVEQDFLDLVTMPMRKRVAATQLEATKLRVGDRVLALAAEVRKAFYEAQAAEQVLAMRRLISEAAEASAELARRQHEAGTMSDLAFTTELGLASQVRLDLKRSEGEAAVAREHLTRLMGVWGTRTGWRLGPKLPELPREEVPLERLEAIAIDKRLDVAAARRELQAVGSMLSLSKSTRWTGFVNVEVEAARLRGDKRISFGPRASLELPLFDQRQAAVARLESLERTSRNELHRLSIDARSEVREARARLVTARAMVEEYGGVLVPLRENIVKYSQEQYDAMLLGVYQLLAAKQSEFATYREYIEALRDYWVARSDLERAVGTRLGPVTARPPAASPVPAASPAPQGRPAHPAPSPSPAAVSASAPPAAAPA
ncbi:MAG TPA: TolC family protein [Polyangiaceae bacterium]|nr:TolC family protein [Polyangiaceae bacterium]